MGVIFQSGYTLPGGAQPLTHARIAHAGNWLTGGTVAVNSTGTLPDAPLSPLTYERWAPWANVLAAPSDMSNAVWLKTGVTAPSPARIAETAANSSHFITQNVAMTAGVEHILSFVIRRETAPVVRLWAQVTGGSYSVFFDLRAMTVGTTTGGAVGRLIPRADGSILLAMRFTPVADTSALVRLYLNNAALDTTYLGDPANTVRIERAAFHRSLANWDYDHRVAAAADYCLVAGHNLGSTGSTIVVQYWTGTAWTSVMPSTAIVDDSPIMIIFGPQTRQLWRFQVRNGALPEIAVIRFGTALQMPQRIWQGVSPSQGNRDTEVIGNQSETGEYLSRRIVRRKRSAAFQWRHLDQAWVRANLYGRNRLIDALEREPFAIAWRPGEVADVDFGWVPGGVSAPVITQLDLMDFGFQAEVHSHD